MRWAEETKQRSSRSPVRFYSPVHKFPSAHGGKRNQCTGVEKQNADCKYLHLVSPARCMSSLLCMTGREHLWRAAEPRLGSTTGGPFHIPSLPSLGTPIFLSVCLMTTTGKAGFVVIKRCDHMDILLNNWDSDPNCGCKLETNIILFSCVFFIAEFFCVGLH